MVPDIYGPQLNRSTFDFDFNKKMNRSLVFDLATTTFIARREVALFLGLPGTERATWLRLSDTQASGRPIE
jgi:hypothetical protein